MVDKVKDGAIWLRDFLQGDKIAWFVFGLIIGFTALYFTYKWAVNETIRADKYEDALIKCQDRTAEIRAEAERDAIQTIQNNMQSIMQISDIIKASNEMQETYIEQRKKRTQENKSLIKEIEKIKNENS